MKKYGLFTLTPKGLDISKYTAPSKEEVKAALIMAGHVGTEIDPVHGEVVLCHRKPSDLRITDIEVGS